MPSKELITELERIKLKIAKSKSKKARAAAMYIEKSLRFLKG